MSVTERSDSGSQASTANVSPPAPRTTEQLVTEATTGHGLGFSRRPARGHSYDLRGLNYVPSSRLHEGRFGRMFRLPPFVPSDGQIAAIAAVMVEPAPFDPNLDNPDIPAGYTYLGQFIDHDITFDPASSLDRANDPDALTNFRSPRFDLDCVYGRGPADDPFMYDDNDPGRLLVDHHDGADDLPRNRQGTAIIGDPRNDENIFVSQLQLTMIKFHNKVLDFVKGKPAEHFGSETDFEAAQRLVRWHYQWLVVHDFLRRTVGDATHDAVLDETGLVPRVNREFYTYKHDPYMPVEFSVAAYRFGHSQIRGRYKLNTFVPALPVFTADSVNTNPLGHFGGFRVLPPAWTIEWGRFFDLDGITVPNDLQQTRRIDRLLVDQLTQLPPEIADVMRSLIERNLTRGARMLLPSGQDVAAHMGVTPLSDADLDIPGGGPAPLWYYILREAELLNNGNHLGPVGGRIVAEVFLGLLEKDPSSYLRNRPMWKPTLPSTTPGDFTVADLVNFADHGLTAVTAVPS